MSFVLNDVGFSYGLQRATANLRQNSKPDVRVLQDVNLTITSGSRIALLGPSGVGKSTLMCILGLLTGTRRFEGRIEYTDSTGTPHQYQGLSTETAERLRRTEFGFALQSSYLLPHLTVEENLGIPLGLLGVPTAERRNRALQLLETAEGNLLSLADSLPSELSGGQQQRVAVLRALIHNPAVVFADEPFSALDEENKRLILQMLVTWQEEGMSHANPAATRRTLFLVCHDPEVPAKYGATILRMNPNSKIAFPGTTNEP